MENERKKRGEKLPEEQVLLTQLAGGGGGGGDFSGVLQDKCAGQTAAASWVGRVEDSYIQEGEKEEMKMTSYEGKKKSSAHSCGVKECAPIKKSGFAAYLDKTRESPKTHCFVLFRADFG